MQWHNHGEQEVFTTKWFSLKLADVQLPDGRHLDHYLLRHPPTVIATIVDDQDRVLLLWRHRFILDAWGYEFAAGAVEPGESNEEAARRELLEETGWRAGSMQLLVTLEPQSGFSDSVHHVYWAQAREYVGPPVDDFESERVEWVPLKDVPDMIARGEVRSANAVAGLLMLHRLRGL